MVYCQIEILSFSWIGTYDSTSLPLGQSQTLLTKAFYHLTHAVDAVQTGSPDHTQSLWRLPGGLTPLPKLFSIVKNVFLPPSLPTFISSSSPTSLPFCLYRRSVCLFKSEIP